MATDGKITAQIGEHLASVLGPRGYDVLFDHGVSSVSVGNLVSWFGEAGSHRRDSELGQIDIAVRERASMRTIALIEIEETNDRPKTLLGDVFAVLLGDHISFKGEELRIGAWTTLVVLGVGPNAHGLRDKFLARTSMLCQQSLSTENRLIGRIEVASVAHQSSLGPRLIDDMEQAIGRLHLGVS